jgi:YD repeat-containing protein
LTASDGARDYARDAENRLIGITYPGVSGKATAFAYDGLGRRISITSRPIEIFCPPLSASL